MANLQNLYWSNWQTATLSSDGQIAKLNAIKWIPNNADIAFAKLMDANITRFRSTFKICQPQKGFKLKHETCMTVKITVFTIRPNIICLQI